jgi:glycosyltransferase involved in cell wall biosynthesis
MRLLITTQIVDRTDPRLGFFHRWIEEFARYCEHVEVICLYEGEHSFPANVRVHSLRKEHASATSFQYASRFYKKLFHVHDSYDAVFVHMNPEYMILGGLWWRLTKKRSALWYLHKSVNMKLRLATFLTNVVLTASKESFRLPSNKVRIVGHGIASEKFAYHEKTPRDTNTDALSVVSIGRISRAKGLSVVLEAAALLAKRRPVTLTIIGEASSSDDRNYRAELMARAEALRTTLTVEFLGPKTNDAIATLLPTYDFFLHASTGTGSVDKAALEALFCGVPVVSSSEAFADLLTPAGLSVSATKNATEESTAHQMAASVEVFLARVDQDAVRKELRETVVERYSLATLIPRILATLA